MAPSNALQDRIRQFEAHDSGTGLSRPPKPLSRDHPNSRPSYPPAIARIPTSNNTNTYSNFLEDPISPTAASYTIIKPSVPYVPRKPRVKSPSPSPPNLDCNTSLIDLKEWVVEENPKSTNHYYKNDASAFTTSVCLPIVLLTTISFIDALTEICTPSSSPYCNTELGGF